MIRSHYVVDNKLLVPHSEQISAPSPGSHHVSSPASTYALLSSLSTPTMADGSRLKGARSRGR